MKRVSKKQEKRKMSSLNSKVLNNKGVSKRKSLKQNGKSRNNQKKKQLSLIRRKNVKQNKKKRKTRRIRKQKGGYSSITSSSCAPKEPTDSDIFQSSFEHRTPVEENTVNVRDSYSLAFKNSLERLIYGKD